jgi:hypothetical protein
MTPWLPWLIIIGTVWFVWLVGPRNLAQVWRDAHTPPPAPTPPWTGCPCACDFCRSIPPKHGHSVIVEVATGKIVLGGHHAGEVAYAEWCSKRHAEWEALGPEGQAARRATTDWTIAQYAEYRRRRERGDPTWQTWLPPWPPGSPRTPPQPEVRGLRMVLLRLASTRAYEAHVNRMKIAYDTLRKEAARSWYAKRKAEIEEWSTTLEEADRAWREGEPLTPYQGRLLSERNGRQLLLPKVMWGARRPPLCSCALCLWQPPLTRVIRSASAQAASPEPTPFEEAH